MEPNDKESSEALGFASALFAASSPAGLVASGFAPKENEPSPPAAGFVVVLFAAIPLAGPDASVKLRPREDPKAGEGAGGTIWV